MAAQSDRDYDIVLFGATGFTGRLTAERLAARADGLRWAIAGRNRGKLEGVRHSLGDAGKDVGVEVVDVSDQPALDALAARTRVLATTVGPYAKLGMPVVRAAVAGGAHYCDITGEPDFVNQTITELDEAAMAAGIKVVSCCGFDSIPADLGAQFCAEQLPDDQPMTVKAFLRVSGRPSGGTVASAIEAIADFDPRRKAPRPRGDQDRKVGLTGDTLVRVPELGGFGVALPIIDPQIVTRSAKLLPEYGPDFRYGHYLRVKSPATLAALGVGGGAFVAAAKFGPTRKLLLDRVTPQGEGPDKATRDKSFFKLTFLGEAGDVRVRTTVSGGDAGYDETSKMLSETAIALARGEGSDHVGVITPAVALGPALRARLVEQGMAFSVDPAGW